MDASHLIDFINNRMRMSHIYQPVMLTTLIQNGGRASDREIAASILSHDASQLEYYENVTRQMVGRVLTRHGIVRRERAGYALIGYDGLTQEKLKQLTDLCQRKLAEYIERRGRRIWDHRRKSVGYISGTLRYEILRRAKFRCELCGVSADEKALEVDHIVPRIKRGPDDLTNLQALCFSCNAMKRDRDETDFRAIRESYELREAECLFCNMESQRIIRENRLGYAIRDGYPVTPLHTLVVPKRHVASYFDLGRPEVNACNQLLEEVKDEIARLDSEVQGFNIGVNDGEVAGQTVFHCHIHLIPRRRGDAANPRGGVRHIISGKGNYPRDCTS